VHVVRVTLPSGGVVQAHGLMGIVSIDDHHATDWGLYLDDGWRARPRSWPCRFVTWQDFGLPANELDAFDAFDEAWMRACNGEVVDVACVGGIGRTGTALACIAVHEGVPVDEAVTWVRTNYQPSAVETDDQHALVMRFAAWLGQK
jgi:protein-tyrosine phosphatase family protein